MITREFHRIGIVNFSNMVISVIHEICIPNFRFKKSKSEKMGLGIDIRPDSRNPPVTLSYIVYGCEVVLIRRNISR
jgi:hypothetical protein